MVAIEQSGRTLTEPDIESFERRICRRLPEPYRQFLLSYNGGRPTPDTIDVNGLPGSPTDIHTIFSADESDEENGIEEYLRVYAGRISNDLLPIARDSAGNLFCISLSESDYGSVVFCDFDPNLHIGGASYYRVAPNFNRFLEGIRSFENN